MTGSLGECLPGCFYQMGAPGYVVHVKGVRMERSRDCGDDCWCRDTPEKKAAREAIKPRRLSDAC